MRLDKYLVEHGYFESRNRAIDAIKAGNVLINEKQTKPSQKVDESSNITIESEKFYISRAAKKLDIFLDDYPLKLKNRKALDIGSSTGGFAQVLLGKGVSSLHCVDVGRDQLHHSLRANPIISLHEETDIREFESDIKFDLITCDVSFISILYIIDSIDRLASPRCDILILYKPQFEVGKDAKRDRKGVVVDRDAIRVKREGFLSKIQTLGWELKYETPSPISGREGNREWIYHFSKGS